MPTYEVGVKTFEHITVEADSKEDAKKKAEEQSDLPRANAYQAVEVEDAL